MGNSIKHIGTIYNGRTVCVQIGGVKNNSSTTVHDVFVDVTIPEGVSFYEANVPQGSYNPTTNIWTIGSMVPDQELVGEICFSIDNECLSSFKFNFGVDSITSCDGCLENNFECIILEGISCCELASCGFTRITDLNIDESCPDPLPTDPTTPPDNPVDGQYHIQFYQDCEIWWQYDKESDTWSIKNGVVAGAGTVSRITNTIPGHRIARHDDQNGLINDINETITSINPIIDGNKIAGYLDEEGTEHDIDESVTSLSNVVTTGNVITFYNREDGTSSPIYESITSVTNTVAGNRIATHNSEDSSPTDINETVTSLVENPDGTLTYTDEAGADTTVVGASNVKSIRTETSDYVINVSTDYTVIAAPGCDVITLPDPTTTTTGRIFYVHSLQGTPAYVISAGGASILTRDRTFAGISVHYSMFQNDGTNWVSIHELVGVNVTPTPTASPSLFTTPTPTPTVSITTSLSPTPSISLTVTPTVTPSVTVSPSGSMPLSVTPTPTATVTPSVSLTATPSVTPSPSAP